MAKHKKRGRHTPARVAHDYAAIEQVLDRMDEAMIAGRSDEAYAITQEIWNVRRQLPEVLTRRLIEGRAQIPFIALDMLEGFAGQHLDSYLQRIAGASNVPDIVRFGARRRQGWPEDEKLEARERREFLATLEDAGATLIAAAEQGSFPFPPDGAVLEEAARYLMVLPAQQRRRLLGRTAAELGPGATWLLHAFLHSDDPKMAQIAIRELLRLHPPGSSRALERLGLTARDESVRAAAVEAAPRLRLQPVGPDEPGTPVPLPPVDRVLISMLDGSGTQVIMVIRRLAPELLLFADFLIQDGWGVKSALGSIRATPDLVEEFESRFGEDATDLVQADLAAARGTIAAALAENAATGHGVPPEFEFWEMHLHDIYPPPAVEPSLAPELDDEPLAGRHDLLPAGEDLPDHDAFDSWGFEPDLVLAALSHAPPPRGRWTNRQYRPLITRLVPPPERDRLRRNLRRQAWLLDRAGDHQTRDVSLATAAAMKDAKPADLVKLPFLRHLVEHSVTESLGPVGVLGPGDLLVRLDAALGELDDDEFDELFPLILPPIPALPPARPPKRRGR